MPGDDGVDVVDAVVDELQAEGLVAFDRAPRPRIRVRTDRLAALDQAALPRTTPPRGLMASPLDVQVILCDAAQADPGSGKLHMLGAGWSDIGTPTTPHAVAIMIKVPWDRTNQKLPLRLELVDGGGHTPQLTNGQVLQIAHEGQSHFTSGGLRMRCACGLSVFTLCDLGRWSMMAAMAGRVLTWVGGLVTVVAALWLAWYWGRVGVRLADVLGWIGAVVGVVGLAVAVYGLVLARRAPGSAGSRSQSSAAASGERSIAIGGDNSGIASAGDNATNIQRK